MREPQFYLIFCLLRSSGVHSQVEQSTNSRGYPTGLNYLSEHPPCVVAPLRYSSSIVVEHSI
ncbi:hypothetical protein Syun_027932 [Stephania yunnanensis]|uniref:Uncharacterized protein n=1 Tax=Stephania yunnanensis TaxID=152371 RepID=A0AAP0EGF3_9MAGN